MIFSTFNQVNCFLVFLFFGFVLGFLDCLFSVIFLKNYQKNFLKCVFDTIFYTFLSIIFIFLLNFYNFGEFSVALIFAYILGFYLIKKLMKKLVAFLINKWYNIFKKLKVKKNEKRIKKN